MKPGDKVTITDNHGPFKVLAVTAVKGRKVTLADGSEWKADGWPWDAVKWYQGPTMEPHEPEHDAAIVRRRAAHKARKACEAIDWARVTTEQAEAISALVASLAP